jgi:D-alanyl-D-alanine dipeptidase
MSNRQKLLAPLDYYFWVGTLTFGTLICIIAPDWIVFGLRRIPGMSGLQLSPIVTTAINQAASNRSAFIGSINTNISNLFATKKSPGSIAVGAAEGNMTYAGAATGIYYGHTDPGNHVTNRGFCSWNKAAGMSVSEADRRCLSALQRQAALTEQKLIASGLDPKQHAVALVMGVDLCNQSNSACPNFALNYKNALRQGKTGESAFIWARVEAFRSPSTGVLDASGLFGICATQSYYIRKLALLAPYSEQWRWNCIALDQGRRIREASKALKIQARGQ